MDTALQAAVTAYTAGAGFHFWRWKNFIANQITLHLTYTAGAGTVTDCTMGLLQELQLRDGAKR